MKESDRHEMPKKVQALRGSSEILEQKPSTARRQEAGSWGLLRSILLPQSLRACWSRGKCWKADDGTNQGSSHKQHGALCPITTSILACSHRVIVAAPTLRKSQPQPSLPCPALKAEPACF